MASAKFQGPEEWDEWTDWLAAGLHGRNSWRLSVLLAGVLFAQGRRTVGTCLRAAGVSADYVGYYDFLARVGRKAKLVSWRLLSLVLRVVPLPERILLVLDDTPTKRYGPKVEGADVHHNPTPGPADQEFLYGHVWVTLSLAVRHPSWGERNQTSINPGCFRRRRPPRCAVAAPKSPPRRRHGISRGAVAR